jgi:beta-phosphoglucomutase-like phosphatase (HAD superfamily)
MYKGFIFDVDGVLVDSPHEQAWGDTLRRLMENNWTELTGKTPYSPEKYTSEVYQTYVSGKPRREGAACLLAHFDIPDPGEKRLDLLCDTKQAMIVELIDRGEFVAFDDALRFILSLKAAGIKLAAASSSKNANRMLGKVMPATFCRSCDLSFDFVTSDFRLLDVFDANVCGRDFKQGKPHPEIFLTAAEAIGIDSAQCVVIEDAPSGVQAAKAGGMACIGLARRDDSEMLKVAGADWVVESLDQIDINKLIG